MIDSFGVRLAGFNSVSQITASQSYENFYDENNNSFGSGAEFLYNFHLCLLHILIKIGLTSRWTVYNSEKVTRWLKKYATVNHQSQKGKNGFILKNGTFQRFESIGISWNDSYCRKVTDTGPSGCFVERDISTITDFDYQANNCTGKDSILFGEKFSL